MENIVIVGAGQAGAGAALQLRTLGFEGSITLLGDEPHPPYERPELSKGYALGQISFDKLIVLDEAKAAENWIDMRLGSKVTEIDRAQKRVLCGKEAFPYDKLILATGGLARQIPLPEPLVKKALSIRNRDDADRLAAAFERSGSVAVIGGGWLGLEAAATCRAKGLEVHVFEASERLCARVAPEWLSSQLAELHNQNGVKLHMGEKPEILDSGYIVSGYMAICPDLIIVAVGLSANDHGASKAGLKCADGVFVDAHGRTSDADIYAIGDCARYRERGGLRRESWQNANQSAEQAARSILGLSQPPADADWFWSKQYGQNFQMLGVCEDSFDQVDRQDEERGSRSRFYLKDGKLAGCVGINAERDIGQARNLVKTEALLNPDLLSNSSNPIRKCVC